MRRERLAARHFLSPLSLQNLTATQSEWQSHSNPIRMAATTTSFVAARNLTPRSTSPSSPPATGRFFEPPHCSPYRPTTRRVFCKAEVAILCQDCNGIGWLLCDFCKGQKTNVISGTNRVYRRCPSCRAIGQVLCSKCKAFKCVTFPNYNDGEKVSI